MRQTIYILTLGILSCNGQINNTAILAENYLSVEEQESTENTNLFQPTNPPETTYNEIDFIPPDSLFSHLELELKEITVKEFKQYENAYKINCRIDSGGFISGYGLVVTNDCYEICQTSIVDTTDGKIMILPSDYDQGILGLTFSPSCNQFIIYSCYDSPDYDKYYQYRSEIIGFNITSGKGLEAIKPSFKYHTKEWSIGDLIWVGNKTIALKVYVDGMPSDGNGFDYKYFKTDIHK